MTANIVAIFDHTANHLEAARQEYYLAKQHVLEVCAKGKPWLQRNQQEFHAAMDRQAEARERYLRALGA